MSNTQQTAKRRFNAIDVFIIVLVVLCILGIYFRSQIAEWVGIENKVEEYKITFKISEIRYTSDKYLQPGNEVYISNGNILLGTIEGNCTVLPAEVYVTGPDGVPIKANYPKDTYVDVIGVVKCMGMEKEDGFYLGGTYALAPGSKLDVRTEMLDFSITITEISK